MGIIRKIKWWFRKTNLDNYNLHHPDFTGKTELAFTSGGTDYYRMVQEVNMPYGRYKYVSAALQEVDLRMSLKIMIDFIDVTEKLIDSGQLGKAYVKLEAMRSRTRLQFEPETAKNLASIIYFDETESLIDFDREYAKKKLEKWDREGGHDFFLTRPMKELLGLSDISQTTLIDYIKEATDLINELMPETLESSSTNSSTSKPSI